MRRSLLLLLAVPVLCLPALAVLLQASPTCRLQVIPDYVTPIGYRAVLRPSPACAYGTVLRVRKSSTLNTRRNGAPYQPIRPEVGAWEVGQGRVLKTPVPRRELSTSTLTGWRWEYWSAETWNPRTNTKGRWLAAEVLRAAP